MVAREGCRSWKRSVCIWVCVYVFRIREIIAYLMLMGMNLQEGKNWDAGERKE